MGEWREVTTYEEGESGVEEIIENDIYSAVILVWLDPPPGPGFIDEAKRCSQRHPWRAGIYINIPSDEGIPDKLKKGHYNVSDKKCAAILNRKRSVSNVLEPDEKDLIEVYFLDATSS